MVLKKDLKDQITTGGNEFLKCFECECEYSANSGDYWDLADDHQFKCECGNAMDLCTKTVKYNKIITS